MASAYQADYVFEDSAFSLMARVHANGSNVTQAVVSAISIKVYDQSDPTTIVGSEYTPVVASTIYDTLQTDARWTKDPTGYNFRWDASDSVLPDGSKRYNVEVKITPTSGSPYHFVVVVPTRELGRS